MRLGIIGTNGKGMDTMPGGMNECSPNGCVGEKFRYVPKGFQNIMSMEQLAKEAGITDYTRFICGYHIHGQAAIGYDSSLCALDWYAQTTADRLKNPGIWDHYLILDQV